MQRTIPYYVDKIVPDSIAQGKNVLIASSENAIRGLLMHLCEVSDVICIIIIPIDLILLVLLLFLFLLFLFILYFFFFNIFFYPVRELFECNEFLQMM